MKFAILKKTAILLTICLLVVMAAVGCTSGSTPPAEPNANFNQEQNAEISEDFVSIGTSSSGGIFNALGVAMSQVWTEMIPGVKFSAQVTGGSGENSLNIGSEKLDIALAAGSVAYEAANGLEQFEGKQVSNIRAIAALYPAVLQVPVLENSGMNNILDLKGKKINVGQAGSGSEAVALSFLRSFGIDPEKDIKSSHLSHDNASDAMIDEKIAGYIQVGGIGIGHQMKAMASGKSKIVPLEPKELRDKFLKEYPYYFDFKIQANAYPNQDYTVDTIASSTLLVARESLSEELVYQVTKQLFENLDTLAEAHSTAKEISLDNALKGVGIPLHPGAERYYKEVGLIK